MASRAKPIQANDATHALALRLAETREQQAASNDILRLMASSPGDVQPVLDAVAKWATRLCRAPFARVMLLGNGELQVVGHHSVAGEAPIPILPIALKRTSITGRAVLDRKTIHYADLVPLLDTEFPEARGNIELIGARAVLAVPLAREDDVRGAIFLWRREPGLFAPDQVELVQTFARQAAIAIENVRLFNEVKARNRELSEALEQQEATSEILRAIAGSPTDIRPVLETVVHAAARFCGAPNVLLMRVDGDVLRGAAAVGPFGEVLRARSGSIEGVEMPLTRESVSGRAAIDRCAIHVHDLAAESDAEYPVGRDLQRRYGHRTILCVPLLREGTTAGVLVLFRTEANPFSERQLELTRTFADQAVIAIENVRLFTELGDRNGELSESLEQQTATSEILRAISSSPTNLQPIFDIIAERAVGLCRADVAVVSRFDGRDIQLAAIQGVVPEGVDIIRTLYPMHIDTESITARVIRGAAIVHSADVLSDDNYALKDLARAARYRGGLGVPIVRGTQVIGCIFVGRSSPGLFSDSQVDLLETFADQAVIAIENVRLFTELDTRNRELTEALEQQTATSDILRVISQSPTDVQPVFDTIADAALKLCNAANANVFTFDGELIHLAAIASNAPEGAEAMRRVFPRPASRETAAARTVLTRSLVVIPDVMEDPEFMIGSTAAATGFRSIVSVPLMREGNPIGVIGVGRAKPGPFPDEQIALLKTFADQAVIAIENVRLFTELEARNKDLTELLEQQTATSDILRVISQSQQNVQPVFDTIAASALNLCRASAANVVTLEGRTMHMRAVANVSQEGADALRRVYPRQLDSGSGAGRAILTGRIVAIPDAAVEHGYAIGGLAQLAGFRSVLSIPLLREGKPIGAINVGRSEPGTFSDNQKALLETFADQAVIAIENVRLFKELEARTTQLTQSVDELKALGEVGQAVSSTLDLETVLRTIVARATNLAGMDGGAIYEYNEAKEQFYLHTAERYPAELVDMLRAEPVRKGEGALGRLAVVAEPVQIRDVAHDRTYRSRVREILLRLGYRSSLAIPLLRENRLLGGLIMNRRTAGDFEPRVIELLKTFATQSALAIQNARLFREIADKSRELEVASRHKSEFLANMSHELRTPLNAIIGFSEVLAEEMFGGVNTKQAEYLADILESGRHLLSLINDILDLSKIEAGRMELDLADFSLPSAIENAVTLIRERAHRRGITLERALDDRVGAVRADERKVKQVLLNLLTNALKFTPEGGRISVQACVRGGAAEVRVTDTGIGISPQDQATVFEEFRQVGTMAKKVEGTGLGLAISRKFIELHGGKIWVTSEVGVGSTFGFTLPQTNAS